MEYKSYLLALCLYYCCLVQAVAQVHESALPFSVLENLPVVTEFENMPSSERSFCKEKAAASQKPIRFACPFRTALTPDNSGQWIETPEGRVWRLGIRSANAYSIYLSMRYLLLPGARLFVYSPEYEELRGAFTSRNNSTTEVLSVAPIRGDRIIVELNLAQFRDSFGTLEVTKVYHDFSNIFATFTENGRNSATTDTCGEDINCSNGNYWQTEKRSVVKIISNGAMGTGTLVGNTSGSDVPYVLTASHLISSAESAAEAIFLFNHETSGCQGDQVKNAGGLSGASLISTAGSRLDFSLLKLNHKPPSEYHPFYAGWDARNAIAQKGICIHHPFGRAKQIAIEYHPIESEDIGRGFDENSTWKVSHWELGLTEAGSSGAPLFNEQHRIIGTLTGGRSTCGYAQDDYFTKFGASWDNYPDPSSQLKYWLDPAQTGHLTLDGYDPYGFNAEHCDTAWNYFPHDELALSHADLAWGWISGHNSAGYSQFAERYESAGVFQVNGVFLNVAKAYASNPLANIELKIWEGSQYPQRERYSKLVFLRDLQPNKINFVALDSVIKQSGTLFVGYKINYNAVSDTFALYHAVAREPSLSSTTYIYKDRWLPTEDPGALGVATSLGLGISQCYGKSNEPGRRSLVVYPNPSSNFLTLDIPNDLAIQGVKCFDNKGRAVSVSLRQTELDNRLYFNLPSGIYYLKIITREKSLVVRFIVLKE